ncbi:hypothetical protein R615_13030 [Thalassolituus oleivorans R6-15]|nr:hypothetical protein R615_13030 [Thalassolituus oleivorans R6-15]
MLKSEWFVGLGNINLYFSSNKLMPAKTRDFIDYIVAEFDERDLEQHFSANNK